MTYTVGQLIAIQPNALDVPRACDAPDFFRPGTLVGIEIEMERYDFLAEDLVYWSCVGDGSLRNNGIEFVSHILGSKDIAPALDEIGPRINKYSDSWRAGIHVHVNVNNLTFAELMSACKLYALLEPLLFTWEGNNRDKSNFCPPWSVLPTHPKALADMLRCINTDHGGYRPTAHDCLQTMKRTIGNLRKYSAVNLASVYKHGTIEFRFMRSSKDVEKIRSFVKLCASIVEVGSGLVGVSPLDTLSSNGADYVVDMIEAPFLKKVKDYERLIWDGVTVANILHAEEIDYVDEDEDAQIDSILDVPLIA